MEAVFQDCIDEFTRRGAHRAAVEPHPRRGRGLCDRVSIIRAGRTVETGTLADLRHLTRTSISPSSSSPRPGSTRLAGRPRPRGRGRPGAVRGRHRAARTRRSRPSPRFGIRTLTSQPPDAGGAVPAPLRRRARGRAEAAMEHDDAAPAPSCGSFLRRDRWMLRAGGSLGARRCSTVARPSASTGSTRPRPSSTGPRRAWRSNAAFIAMAGPARALNTIGGQVTWQASAFGAIVAGPDEHVPRRPPHPRRGGERPRRAACARARRALCPLAAAALSSLSPTCSSGRWSPLSLIAYGLAAAGLGRASASALDAVRAGLRRRSRWSPPSSPRAPGRCTASPAP